MLIYSSVDVIEYWNIKPKKSQRFSCFFSLRFDYGGIFVDKHGITVDLFSNYSNYFINHWRKSCSSTSFLYRSTSLNPIESFSSIHGYCWFPSRFNRHAVSFVSTPTKFSLLYLQRKFIRRYAQINNNSWPFGNLFCKIWLTIDDVATMASVLSIVAITIERYWSINHSVHYRRYTSKTRIRIFSILIWLIPFVNFAPGIWLLQPKENLFMSKKNHSECIGAYHSHTIYLLIAQINFFAWPLVVIIILNALIVVNLYHRSFQFPSYGSFLQQKKPKDLPVQKAEQRTIVGHDEPTISIIHENNSHMFQRMNLEVSNSIDCFRMSLFKWDNHTFNVHILIKDYMKNEFPRKFVLMNILKLQINCR